MLEKPEGAASNRNAQAVKTGTKCWSGMLARCYDQRHRSFHNYGGSGVTVCERWRTSFANFIADMGPRPSPKHTVDRIDPSGNYEPSNCRWATASEQARNRRKKLMCTVGDETMTLIEACERYGVNYGTAYGRWKLGYPVVDATPLRRAS